MHDAAAAMIGSSAVVLGGGSPDTVPTVQTLPSPAPADRHRRPKGGRLATSLSPRSDLADRHHKGPTGARRLATYIVGGYDGTHYLPGVLGYG